MTLNVTLAAQQLGISDRQVRRAIDEGELLAERVGSSYIIHPLQVQAYSRVNHRGRRWSEQTQEATLSLLSKQPLLGLTPAERSRLTRRVNEMELSSLVGQIMRGKYSLTRGLVSNKNSYETATVLTEMGLSQTGGLKIVVDENAAVRARELRLAPDAGGDTVVIHGSAQNRKVLEACALYIFGDVREHSASRSWLENVRRTNDPSGDHSS